MPPSFRAQHLELHDEQRGLYIQQHTKCYSFHSLGSLSMNFPLVMFTAGDREAEPVHAGQSCSSNTGRVFDADTVRAAKKKSAVGS